MSREQGIGNREQGIGNREQGAGSRAQSGKNISLLTATCYLLLITCSLLPVSCNNHLSLTESSGPHDLGPGMGWFTIANAQRNMRTISPKTPVIGDFEKFTLVFSPVEHGQERTLDVLKADMAKPIALLAGTYTLSVTAYLDDGKNKRAATGEITGIIIAAGTGASRDVLLKAIIDGDGQGTFRWIIDFPASVDAATMIITPYTGGTARNIDLLGAAAPDGKTGSLDLGVGYYRVVFDLHKPNAEPIVFREFLYIYQNLESVCTETFTEDHFNNALYTVTFNSNGGVPPGWDVSVLHGSKAIEPVDPTRTAAAYLYEDSNKPSIPANAGFKVEGWYDNAALSGPKYDFDTSVYENITLYAKWEGAINVSAMSGNNDFEKAVSYVNANKGAYTLLLAGTANVPPQTLNASGAKLTIEGIGSNRIISLTANGSTFTISGGAELALGTNITVGGRGSNNNALFTVNAGGTFTMTGGIIRANTVTSGNDTAAGINVNGGTFNMSGGSITANSNNGSGANKSGGVRISNSGTFTMSGGTISGNETNGNGSGVCVNNGTFTMSGGAIIAANNDVYLASGRTITIGGPLTAATPIATITPNAYTQGTQLITLDSGATGITVKDASAQFAVTPNAAAPAIYYFVYTDGNLAAKGTAGVEIKFNGPEEESFTFTPPSGSISWAEAPAGTPISLLVVPPGGTTYDSFQWYVNGKAVSGAANASLAITARHQYLKIGRNIVSVRVQKGGVFYSKKVEFTVYAYPTFANTTDFTSYLATLPANTAANPCTIAMNVSDTTGLADAINSSGKYVILDLSGSSLSSIPYQAFSPSNNGCPMLTSIIIPDSVTSIGDLAFLSCSSLTSITIPNSVTSIGDTAFAGCSSLSSINIPDSVTSIGQQAFYDCSGLSSITIPDGVTSIREYTFYNCSSLTSITIPASVTKIEPNAFYGCTSLASVTFEGTIPSSGFAGDAFPGDLRDKFYQTITNFGTPGTYTRESGGGVWTYVGFTSASGIELVYIPAGTFEMGQLGVETPAHQVTLSAGFYMGKYQVTQDQWSAVMAGNTNGISASPSNYTTAPAGENAARLPVEQVSWYDALVFCNRLSVMEGLSPAYSISGSTDPAVWGAVPTISNASWDAVTIVSGSTGYRLPTEAQWEYACRAGTTTAYNTGDTISDSTGWYSANSGSMTHEVGKKLANAWGLYDMHGNVWEWCWDWYGAYSSGAQTDPLGASSGTLRVLRGGGWNYGAEYLRSANRLSSYPDYRNYHFGFRILRP